MNVTRYSDLELTTQLNLGNVHTAMDGLKIAYRCFEQRENTERLCVNEVSGQVFQPVENLSGAVWVDPNFRMTLKWRRANKTETTNERK